MERRFNLLIILYISILTQVKCETTKSNRESTTKTDKLNLVSSQCHTCFTSNNEVDNTGNLVENVIDVMYTLTAKDSVVNNTIDRLELEVENLLERAISRDSFEIFDGVEIEPVKNVKSKDNNKKKTKDVRSLEERQGKALFSKYTYEYRMFQKVKEFVNTHVLSIDLPKAAKMIGFRCK